MNSRVSQKELGLYNSNKCVCPARIRCLLYDELLDSAHSVIIFVEYSRDFVVF